MPESAFDIERVEFPNIEVDFGRWETRGCFESRPSHNSLSQKYGEGDSIQKAEIPMQDFALSDWLHLDRGTSLCIIVNLLFFLFVMHFSIINLLLCLFLPLPRQSRFPDPLFNNRLQIIRL